VNQEIKSALNEQLKGYRMRLLQVLVAADIEQIFKTLGEQYPAGDALGARYLLLGAWDNYIESEVLRVIGNRLQP
jgi:hypothetical protein